MIKTGKLVGQEVMVDVDINEDELIYKSSLSTEEYSDFLFASLIRAYCQQENVYLEFEQFTAVRDALSELYVGAYDSIPDFTDRISISIWNGDLGVQLNNELEKVLKSKLKYYKVTVECGCVFNLFVKAKDEDEAEEVVQVLNDNGSILDDYISQSYTCNIDRPIETVAPVVPEYEYISSEDVL